MYILYSKQIDSYYVGHSEDLVKRLTFHNSGKSSFTSRANDWQLMYSESFLTKGEAMKREIGIKKRKVENTLSG